MTENKNLITSYLQAINGRSKTPELVNQYVADPALAAHIAAVEAAFPAYELIPEQMLGEDDMVVLRATFRGVQRGAFAGIEPTGKAVSAGLIIIYQVQNSRIVQHWMQFDLATLLQQLRNEVPAAVA